MAKKFVVGQLVRVNTPTPKYGTSYPEGTEGLVVEIDVRAKYPTIRVKSFNCSYSQLVHPDDLDIIQNVIPVKIQKEEKKVTATETAIPKTDIKTLYTVAYEGETIGVYVDREVAREVKAELGGRAAGADIVQFKPAKTIR